MKQNKRAKKNHNYKHLFFIKSFINRFDVKIVLNEIEILLERFFTSVSITKWNEPIFLWI